MARPLRIEFPDALYHVTSRGDRREPIYEDDDDRAAWLRLLGNVCKRFKWVVHAYCLMGNHFHLMVRTPQGDLSAGMRQLNGVYTQWVNRRHGRSGHVFQGRFKAVLVDSDAYLLELARYVVLNPVRAGMVNAVEDWPWTSYAATAGLTGAPPWLAVDELLSQFSARRGTGRQKYVDHVRAGVGLPSIWQGLQNQIYLGDEDFMARMQRLAKVDITKAGDLIEVPRPQRRPASKPLAHYVATADSLKRPRATAMAQAYATGDYTLAQVAQAFGVHYVTVSRAVTAHESI